MPNNAPTETKPLAEKAVTVGIVLPDENEMAVSEGLDELDSLLGTLRVKTCGRIIQRRQRLTARYLLGAGKAEEIKELAETHNAKLIVFDRELSGPQVRNLESLTGCQILDRHGVILEIFAKHAKTNQAKTQVEIAQLEYMLPKLTGAWTHFQRQKGGGVRSRGMGEKQIEIDRRRVKDKIARLKRELETFARERATQRKSRSKELKVAFVGYTNSGKTTLMHALTRATNSGKNELFATLDANIKTLDPATRPKILMSDTVGFIRNLPHSLVDSFKGTLDEVKEADLLLHVVDLSHHNYKEHIKTTDEVLEEIGAGHIPEIVVFNKLDSVDEPSYAKIVQAAYPGSIALSALDTADAVKLREHVYSYFATHFFEVTLKIPHTDQATVRFVFDTCRVLTSDYSHEDYVEFKVQTTKSALSVLQPFSIYETT